MGAFSAPASEQAQLVDVVERVNGVLPEGILRFDQKLRSEIPDCLSDGGINFADTDTHDFSKRVENTGLKREVTEEQARQIFNFLRDQSDIPFFYISDDCFSRAHVAARLLELSGIYSRKIFLQGPGTNSLLLVSSDVFPVTRPTRFSFHVAVVLSVRLKDGSLVDWVFDPSFDRSPVTVDQWENHFQNCRESDPVKKQALCLSVIKERFAYSSNSPVKNSWDPQDWADAESRNFSKSVQDLSRVRAKAFQLRPAPTN